MQNFLVLLFNFKFVGKLKYFLNTKYLLKILKNLLKILKNLLKIQKIF